MEWKMNDEKSQLDVKLDVKLSLEIESTYGQVYHN